MKKQNKGKLRVSYSLLSLWSSGRHEEAISLYLHKPLPKTKAMQFGSEFHKKLEDAISMHKRIKLGKSTFEFKNPEPEKRIVTPFNDRWDMSGMIDCYDEGTIYEFKSGVISSTDYSNGYQIPFYFLMCVRNDLVAKEAYIIHYNQHEKKADWTKVWNNKEQMEKAENYIDSLAPEIEEYFLSEGVPLEK